MSQLEDYRKEIDLIDKQLIDALVRRFEVTRKIGQFKKDNNIPPVDPNREADMFKKYDYLAQQSGIDSELLKSIMKLIVSRVVSEHKNLV